MIKYSVILPVYNEEKVIGNCLASLAKQIVAKKMEIIVVDDGSTDNSKSKIKNSKLQFKIKNLIFLSQNHEGPGAARNFGAKKAKGEILVFVDADMEFAQNFIEKLVAPITSGQTVGTFSKEEYLLNKDNVWARYWNLNLGRSTDKMLLENHDDTAPVFRAILKSEFEKAAGFDTKVGYTDDWSISKKLGINSQAAPGAMLYHRNPDNLKEVWVQARWFGKNEFLTKSLVRRLLNLFRYCPVWSIFKLSDPPFFIFKVVYNSAVFTSIVLSFFGEQKNK